jgi:hypothetical protein
MFGEIAIVFILFVILPSIILSFVKDIKKEKYKAMSAKDSSSEGGLRASELREIIREAVSDAVEPLDLRIADLEIALLNSGALSPTPSGKEAVSEPRLNAAVVAEALNDETDLEDVLDTPAPRLRT